MKTLLVTETCFESTNHGQLALARMLEWNNQFIEMWGVQGIAVFNNGIDNLPKESTFRIHSRAWPCYLNSGSIHVFPHAPYMPRISSWNCMNWRRSFLSAIEAAIRYRFERLIHVDWDFFILSQRMAETIAGTYSGIVGFWCERHTMPENGCMIITDKYFGEFRRFMYSAPNDPSSKDELFEMLTPWTELKKEMIGDKYGEFCPDTLPINTDFAAAIDLGIRIIRREDGFKLMRYPC